MEKKTKATCHITGLEHDLDELIPGDDVRESLIEEIRKDRPGFNENSYISTRELFRYRMRQMENIVKKEVGEMTELESQVIDKLKSNNFISDNVEPDIEAEATLGERLADKIAEFGGSWSFIIFFLTMMAVWMGINVLVYKEHGFDPYPFILLNLALSCLAALQAPVIMMSQNRQNDKDRARSEHDYQVNLAAELQIRLLHDKRDHMMLNQHKQIVEIQQLQLEMLQELVEKVEKAVLPKT